MASNFSLFWPVFTAAHSLALLDGLPWLKVVQDAPLDPEQWLKAFVATGDTIPAAHLSIKDGEQKISGDTGGAHNEELQARTTVLWQDAQVTPTEIYALRDAIISALETDVSLAGYVQLIICTGWGRDKQEGFSATFHLDWTISHEWPN